MSVNKHHHYYKEWHGKMDVYRVCDLFEVDDAALSHAVKKLLCTGQRGHKDFKKDIEDVVDTLQRKLEMMEEDDGGDKV